MAPVFAVPKALERAGLKLGDIDLVDIHEAFAAQVASNLQALASKKFAEEKLGRSEAVGEIDPRQAQRQRRIDRHRPSVRGDRRAHGGVDAARAEETRTSSTGLLPFAPPAGSARSSWWRRHDARVGGRFQAEQRGQGQRASVRVRDDGVAVVTYDVPGEPVNTLRRASAKSSTRCSPRSRAILG